MSMTNSAAVEAEAVAAEENGPDETLAEDAEPNGETQLSDEEKRAMAMGWSPKDQYKGHPDDWVPAEEFIDSTPTKLRRRLRDHESKYADLERKYAALQTGVKQMQDFQETARKEGYEKGLKEARQKLKEAAAEGDDAGVAAAEAEMDELEKRRNEDKPAETKDDDRSAASAAAARIFDEWKGDNKWYERDGRMRGYADAISQELAASNPNMPLAEHLEAVTAEMRQEFPGKFKSSRQDPPSVESGANGGGIPTRNRARGWTDLPSECRSAFAELVQAGAYSNDKAGKDKYAKSYFEQYPEG